MQINPICRRESKSPKHLECFDATQETKSLLAAMREKMTNATLVGAEKWME
jgi:hypothetical protein